MERAVDHLMTHRAGGLPLKPGGRKTSITLAAFSLLRAQRIVKTMLVIAPLRVCRQVWRQEGAKWSEFRHLRFSLLHGAKKDDALKADADVYLINPEGVPWLCHKFTGRQLPYDIVCIDELTKFKNHQSERSKALRPRIDRTQWKWGLTGSLAPNGYMDLFGQQLMLDGGAALGRYITHYRDQYFQLDYNGFDYNLMPGAERRIVARLAPYWMNVDESDYAQLPEQVDNPIELTLDGASRKLYDKMKRDMIAELPGGCITAANQAACYSKLSQMANGAVYDENRKVIHIHDLKLDAIEELLEELNGEPLLVGYEFNHDLDRLRERFGVVDKVTGKKVIPYLGKGTTGAQEDMWIAQWNRGELPLLCAHPASAGHGLNMQGASAFNVAWFGITWDFELYDQFIRRIRRDGNKSARVFNHLLIVKDSIDELKLEALGDKDMTQGRLLHALNREISRDAETRAGGVTPVLDDRRLPLVASRLPRQSEAARGAEPETTERVTPKGWGARPAAAEPGEAEQRERVAERLAPQPSEDRRPEPAENARSAFSGGVREQMAQLGREDAQGDQPADRGNTAAADKPAATRRTRTPAAGKDEPVAVQWLDPAKVEILKIVFADPATTLDEGLEQAKDMLRWAREA